MLLDILLFIIAMFFLVQSADYANMYSSRLAKTFRLSEFFVSFFVVAVISTFPETAVSVVSALDGIPEFGFAALLGSNVADLTLVFGILALFSAKGIMVKSKILRQDFFYLALLAFPILLGLDGKMSRIDGVILVISCFFFFFTLLQESHLFRREEPITSKEGVGKHSLLLLLSISVLAASAHFAVASGVNLAKALSVPPIFISLILVSLGTCLPELIFSLKAIRRNSGEMALGDILGTVIIDATLIVGITALLNPFEISQRLIYVTGFAMVFACLAVIECIRTERMISKKHGIFLIFFYIIFLIVETINLA